MIYLLLGFKFLLNHIHDLIKYRVWMVVSCLFSGKISNNIRSNVKFIVVFHIFQVWILAPGAEKVLEFWQIQLVVTLNYWPNDSKCAIHIWYCVLIRGSVTISKHVSWLILGSSLMILLYTLFIVYFITISNVL